MKDEITNQQFEDRPATIVEKQYFVGPFDGNDFKHHFFKDIGANEIIFKNVDFSFSSFNNAYLRECQFENCVFIGVKFIDSNLRGSKFINCQFQYSFFRNTEVAHKELLTNLSPWPNANRDWLRRLRINYESIGDVSAVKACVKEEIFASRDHLKKARDAKEGYYAKKYKGLKKQIPVRLESIGNFIDWHLWGHGEYPYKLLITIFSILFIASLYVLLGHYQVSGDSNWNQVVVSFFQAVRDVSYTFVGVNQTSVSDGLAALLAVTRYIVLGLFISVLYKSIARR